MQSNLFNEEAFVKLPMSDGEVYYYGKIMSEKESKHYYDALMKEIEWEHDQAIIMGKLLTTKRKVGWYGAQPFQYKYSGITKVAKPWTPALKELLDLSEKLSKETYNSCLLNLYHDGSEGMAWHSDAEKDLKPLGAIASLSFGVERKFAFKHKQTKEVVSVQLEPGSLLVMTGPTQLNWLHRLPPTTKVKEARVNLTFRTIVGK